METTPFGIFWIILGLVSLFWRDGGVLLSLLAFAAIFQASMVLSLSIGDSIEPILPYYWITILIALRLFWNLATRRLMALPPAVGVSLVVLAAFAVVTTAVTAVAPLVFHGLAVYDPQRSIDAQYQNLGTLEFKISMLGQLGFLWLNLLVLWYTATEIARTGLPLRFVRSLTWAGVAAAFLALWQAASWKLHIPYPYAQLNNAAGWSQGYMQFLAGIKRINGSFTEPSSMAAFMVGFFAFALTLWWHSRDWKAAWLTIMALLALLISTSTTAYLGLMGLLPIWLFFALGYQTRLRRRTVAALLAIGILITASLPAVLAHETVRKVLDSSLVSKATTSSFIHRTAADLRALEILLETGGVGVGLGGNRPSSFAASLISTTGVVGLGLFVSFVILVAAAALRQTRDNSKLRPVAVSVLWGLVGHLLAKQLSQPDLSQPTMWIWLAALVAVAAGSSGKEAVRA